MAVGAAERRYGSWVRVHRQQACSGHARGRPVAAYSSETAYIGEQEIHMKVIVNSSSGDSHEWEMQPGESLTISLAAPPALPPKTERLTLFGWDCPLSQLSVNASFLAAPAYMRDFDNLPSVTGTRAKWAAGSGSGSGTLVHYSDKMTTLNQSLDGYPIRRGWAATQVRPFLYSYWHEPMGDLPASDYVRFASSAVEDVKYALAGAGNSGLLLYHGPILTRAWMEKNPNPAGAGSEWLYEGATAFFSDCYIGSWKSTVKQPYPTVEWMFDSLVSTAREHKLPWGVPEWGGERRTEFDPTGAMRAEWILDCAQYMVAQEDFIAAGWWQRGGTAVWAGSPEAAALNEVLGWSTRPVLR